MTELQRVYETRHDGLAQIREDSSQAKRCARPRHRVASARPGRAPAPQGCAHRAHRDGKLFASSRIGTAERAAPLRCLGTRSPVLGGAAADVLADILESRPCDAENVVLHSRPGRFLIMTRRGAGAGKPREQRCAADATTHIG
jgi:hypothetical protein